MITQEQKWEWDRRLHEKVARSKQLVKRSCEVDGFVSDEKDRLKDLKKQRNHQHYWMEWVYRVQLSSAVIGLLVAGVEIGLYVWNPPLYLIWKEAIAYCYLSLLATLSAVTIASYFVREDPVALQLQIEFAAYKKLRWKDAQTALTQEAQELGSEIIFQKTLGDLSVGGYSGTPRRGSLVGASLLSPRGVPALEGLPPSPSHSPRPLGGSNPT